MTYVKICGITNVDDARCAAEAGADFLGFIFYPKSPRFVTPEQVATITQTIRDEFGARTPRCVGVFVDEPVERVRAVLENAHLDMAQLHGSEPPTEVRMLHPRAFKAIRPQTRDDAKVTVAAYCKVVPDAAALPQFLIDAYHPQQFGGTGIPADMAVAQLLAPRFRLLLAGGLTPETVGPAIEQVQPWGVDVSSGVERAKGIKDHARIRAFIETVRAIDATLVQINEVPHQLSVRRGRRSSRSGATYRDHAACETSFCKWETLSFDALLYSVPKLLNQRWLCNRWRIYTTVY